MTWFRKYYRHSGCRIAWANERSCARNDKCPRCGVEIEPYDWDDLTVIVDPAPKGDGWLVRVSPPHAEHIPDYIVRYFENKIDAKAFAEAEIARLES